jgi:hypothetical protein
VGAEDPVRGNDTIASEPQIAASSAWHRVTVEQGYIRAELFNRKTTDETRRFLEAVIPQILKHGCPRVLLCVRNSKPVFTVERYGFSRYLDIVFKSKYKIALIGDTLELRIAHQYIATLARLRGANVRAFPEETGAIGWLTADENTSQASERV